MSTVDYEAPPLLCAHMDIDQHSEKKKKERKKEKNLLWKDDNH